MPFRNALEHDNRTAALVGIMLLIASYLLFSVRAFIDPVDPGELLSAKRLSATAVGATMFWLVATRWRSITHDAVRGRLWRAAMLFLAALGPVLATRIGYDLLVTGEAKSVLARNLRWIIAWSGYFVAALLGYQLLIRREGDGVQNRIPAWTDDDYLTHLIGDIADLSEPQRRMVMHAVGARPPHDETDPIAYELKR